MKRLSLPDELAEFQINDRQSFQRFLGLHLGHPVPDFSTVWLFRAALAKAEVIKPLFDTYGAIFQRCRTTSSLVKDETNHQPL